MLANERQQIILTRLEERGTVRTIDLANELNVTDETIRRDMQVLAENHQLTRTHGGATSLNGRPKLQSFSERRAIGVEQKVAIAKAALDLISPGKTYAFDSSTTAFELVLALPDLPFRIVTNAYAVIDHLIRMSQIELISTGGRYHPKTQTFVGGDSINALRRHNIDTAFISCIGFDPERGASEGFEQQATFKERLAQFANKVVLLVDSTKLNKKSEYYFVELNQISLIITDRLANKEIVAEIKSHGVEVMIAD